MVFQNCYAVANRVHEGIRRRADFEDRNSLTLTQLCHHRIYALQRLNFPLIFLLLNYPWECEKN